MPDSESSRTDPQDAFERLLDIMRQLRDPRSGCPWDVEQSFETIAPYTIEEAYEVADAIQRQSMSDLKEELGDLLFQVVFHSQMAEETGAFGIADVIEAINDKMLRRHPHVFETSDDRSASDQVEAWEVMKASERAEKVIADTPTSALDGVALALPALMRAEKLQKRAGRTGFDWTDPEDILDKLNEEANEIVEARHSGSTDSIEEEVGDLLFVVANLARRLSVDPEVALRRANIKFEERFRAMEQLASKEGVDFSDLSLEDQEALWQRVKRTQKAG